VKIQTLGGPAARSAPVLRGRSSLWRMLDYLNSIESGVNVPLADAVKDFCVRSSGKGIVVLISDLMDKSGYERALRMLLAQQMDIYVIHVMSREELNPELTGDLKLIDCEDGDVREVTVGRPLIERYRRTVAAFIDGAREFCTRRGMAYLM